MKKLKTYKTMSEIYKMLKGNPLLGEIIKMLIMELDKDCESKNYDATAVAGIKIFENARGFRILHLKYKPIKIERNYG